MNSGCELNKCIGFPPSEFSDPQPGPHNFQQTQNELAFCTYCGKTIRLKVTDE